VKVSTFFVITVLFSMLNNAQNALGVEKIPCGTDKILNKGSIHSPTEHAPDDDSEQEEVKGVNSAQFSFFISTAEAAGISLEDRIKNCAKLPASVKKVKAHKGKEITWQLVSRMQDPKNSKKFYEVWKDTQTGLIWGDRLSKKYKHYDAVKLRDDNSVIEETACNSYEGKIANTNISERKFRLPTMKEVKQANKNGLFEVLPNMGSYFFWTVTMDANSNEYARGYKNYGDLNTGGERSDAFSVRCVSN